jgi:signal transduction histidine kinase
VRQAAIGGMPLYVVSRHSTVAPWRLVYLASAGALSDQPQYPLRELAVLTLLLALPLTASALLGRYLGRRIGALAEAAKSVSNEVMPPAMVPTGLRDIDVVQEALRHAGEAGQERAATRERMYDMEQALHRAQRVESLGQLTAGIAHDFGNLVFTIRGHLELIKRALGNDERVPALVDPPIQLADEAANLICQLSVGIRGKQYKVQQVNVNDLLREVADLLRHVAGRAVQLNLELADDLFDCRLDPTLLKSALLNLVINARNAMRSGGEIRIKSNNLVLEHDAAAAAGLRPGVPYIAVSVADTGIGIAPEVRTRLFEPFFTTREGEAGTGIGLSILYGFVKAADGQVVVDSTVGVGTTFIMYFPAELTPGIPVNSARVTAPVS